jgi:hypothetical protein
LRDSIGKPNIAVIYIHCDYRDKDNQSAADIIGSFAKQLASQAHSIPVAVWELYEPKAKQQETINLESAQKIVNLILLCFDCVYICVDALDECEPTPRRQLLDFLRTLGGVRAGRSERSSQRSKPDPEWADRLENFDPALTAPNPGFDPTAYLVISFVYIYLYNHA